MFKQVLERMGHTYDYEFDWTHKLNQAVRERGPHLNRSSMF